MLCNGNQFWQLILLLINRCLEEGAEDFLLKPVKLDDVKRLKDFIMKGDGKDGGETRIHKRKRQDDYASLSSPSPFPACDPSSPLMRSSSPSVRSSKRAKLRNKDWFIILCIWLAIFFCWRPSLVFLFGWRWFHSYMWDFTLACIIADARM